MHQCAGIGCVPGTSAVSLRFHHSHPAACGGHGSANRKRMSDKNNQETNDNQNQENRRQDATGVC